MVKTGKVKQFNQYLVSTATVIIISGIGFIIKDYVGYRSIALFLLMAVSVLGMLFTLRPVLVAAILSALLWDFFFIPPNFTLTVHETEDLLFLIMYFVIVMMNAVLTFNLQKIEKQTQQKEEKEKTIKLYNTLLDSLSHELRTPISTIIGATDSLKENYENFSEENKKQLIKEISIASLRLNTQVSNLLNMSRLQSGTLQLKADWTDVNEMIYAVAHKETYDIESRPIQIVIPANTPLVKIDRTLIEQSLNNLINNAIQYTPEASEIKIEVRFENEIFNEKNTGFEKIEKYIIIEILDNGPGFPPDQLQKVFQPFYRLRSARAGGTGLGLSIAKGFIEAHKGKIYLENKSEGGAKFTIKIPIETPNLKEL
jgi:two-component system, OmpR family, sensor histidine kinase KdpD